ncbi:PLP-dependent transferase [Bosea sp. MMO-172]|uniref:PLP-dependent transferase n=1 Tax=Bosea sp. MMO-172 TaxID=3127885 RepID=UPI003FA5D232
MRSPHRAPSVSATRNVDPAPDEHDSHDCQSRGPAEARISDRLLRLSIGLESVEDILGDLTAALDGFRINGYRQP